MLTQESICIRKVDPRFHGDDECCGDDVSTGMMKKYVGTTCAKEIIVFERMTVHAKMTV